ncbi:MAG: PAS domain S-box protein [Gammaproteobacteria bacterium]|nr:PAS domain S-box protein [Gammaproteobacteria bacterium]
MKLDNNITTERIRLLYDSALSSISTAIAVSLIFAYVFWGHISSPVIFTWLGFMFFISLAQVWLISDYKKNQKIIDDHTKFENRFSLLAGLIAAGWAFIILQGLSLHAIEERIYSLLLLMSIVAIVSPIFSSSLKTVYCYLTPILLTTIPFLFSQGGTSSALGFALALFSLMLIRSGRNVHQVLVNNITSRFESLKLAENLKQLSHEKSKAELRMQGIMDYAPAAIYVKDLDGHFTFLNQKVADLHHMSREDIIGKTLYDILPKHIADEIHENDNSVIAAQKPLKYEESAPQEDGLHHFISIKFPLYDESNTLYAIAGVSTDITERFRAEELLRISQQRLLLHREQSPVGVIEWNTNFEFIDWNPAAEKIFGFTKEEVAGKHITERILPESAETAVKKVWDDLLAKQGGNYSLNENTTKDGRTILCEWHNTALVDNDGKVIGATSLVDDVTERQKNEDNLRHSQKMDAIGNLTGGIAHDFNNMLGVILGYSELINSNLGDDSAKIEKYSNEIFIAAERAKKLTSTLLDFSRKTPSSAEICDINKSLHGMLHLLEKTLTHRIKLVVKLEEDLWPVWLDQARLEDAILNMSINAMHAMSDNGTLTLTTGNMHLSEVDVHHMDIKQGDYVLLSISDTGIGMDKNVQQNIFDPFYTTKGTGGTGLGLSQVYGFVQQSRGVIRVYSEPGHGTQLAIYIPRYQEINDETPDEENTNSMGIPSGNETILAVDDEAALLELTKEILTSYGYAVLTAGGADQALKILESTPVDLMISDVIMPEIDGYQLATEVEKRYPNIKIQMVSGFSETHKANLANQLLHQQCLAKPFSAEQLLRRVRTLLDE